MNLILEVRRDLRAHRLRSVLSGLSILVAVLSVVAILASASVARDVFVADEEQRDGRGVTMSAQLPGNEMSPQQFNDLMSVLTRRVTSRGGTFAVTTPLNSTVGGSELLALGSGPQNSNVLAIAGTLDRVRRLPIIAGRWLRRDTVRYPPEIVENQAAAAERGGPGTTLGLQASRRTKVYGGQVVGEVADGIPQPEYYTSLASALTADPSLLDGGSSLTILIHQKDTAASTLQVVLTKALAEYGLDSSNIDIVRADHVDQLAGRLRSLQRGFIVSAGVSMVVAVLGLLNIGLASVRERSRELVVRRAIGATRTRLFALVLLTALATAVIACALALTIGAVAIYAVVPSLLPAASPVAAPGFPWNAALVGLVIAIATAAAGATYPATVAARLDVATALRE